MLKVCPKCSSTYGGGQRCAACGARLLDMADRAARPIAASRGVNPRIRAFYAARRGMVVLFAGSLAALALAILFVGFARTSEPPARWAWYAAAALAPILLGLATWWGSARFSRAWKERARMRVRLAPGVSEPPPPPGDEPYL